jgi:hypothetical protein
MAGELVDAQLNGDLLLPSFSQTMAQCCEAATASHKQWQFDGFELVNPGSLNLAIMLNLSADLII